MHRIFPVQELVQRQAAWSALLCIQGGQDLSRPRGASAGESGETRHHFPQRIHQIVGQPLRLADSRLDDLQGRGRMARLGPSLLDLDGDPVPPPGSQGVSERLVEELVGR